MDNQDTEDNALYKVVMNAEEQYSIWPQNRETPGGWREVGKIGDKKECLAFIGMVWTDMRPLSLRKKQPAPSM
ncbi:MAG TPA: MbtH family NRPS accessory protein [Planctomycetota bacterium]|jgi:MbtH protein